jgi:hypothetical protein
LSKSAQVTAQVEESVVEHGKSAEEKIEEFAEDLGRLLGSARAKAEGWLGQRREITKHLEEIRDTASGLLSELTRGGSTAGAGRRPGRPARSRTAAHAGRGPGRPAGSGVKKRTMSAEARARIAAAQKARWAKIRAEQSK